MTHTIVKILSDNDPKSLEARINNYTQELADRNKTVLEIKYQTAQTSNRNYNEPIFTAMIVHNEI